MTLTPQITFIVFSFVQQLAVQARELTQLQSILQNQIEKFGTHMFKEGAMVIPEFSLVLLMSTMQ